MGLARRTVVDQRKHSPSQSLGAPNFRVGSRLTKARVTS
jgi:hypothetical protein